MSIISKLDYMHIGASRSGSSWIWEHLHHHPNIRTPTGKKNVRFWNSDIEVARGRLEEAPTMEWYKTTYNPVAGQINVDCTDSHSWLTTTEIQKIFENYPDVKISYCLRNPVDTLWGHICKKSHTRKSFEYTKKLATCRTFQNKELLPYRLNVNYRENYNNWAQHTNVYCFQFDDIKNKPNEVLQSIAKLMGIDDTVWNNDNRIFQPWNKTKDKPKMDKQTAAFLIDEVIDEIVFMEELFDKDLSNWKTISYYIK